MMITAPFIHELLHPSKMVEYGVQAFFTIGVIAAGKLWIRMMKPKKEETTVPAL